MRITLPAWPRRHRRRPFKRTPTGNETSATVRATSADGFSLIEVLVAGVVLVIGLIFIAHFFTATAMRVLASDTRSLMAQMATEEIETIRGLQYQDVGTVGGHPAGQLAAVETVTVEGREFEISRDVTYFEDASYSGPYPANYRRVTITVTPLGTSGLGPVVMSTNVAGGAKGGTLDITVTDVSGQGLADIPLAITDDLLSPHVLINTSAIRTDDTGHLQVPGLTADPNGGYYVIASKPGYNSCAVQNGLVVATGQTTAVQFKMDRLASMTIRVTDQFGTPLSGIALKVTGYQYVSPWTFNENVTTDGDGEATLEDIRFSTSLEPYFIELVTAHNPPLSLPSGVTAPDIDTTFLPLPTGKIPVILDPGETQTVNLVLSTGPVVTALSPTSGSAMGGTSVVITGANFTGATSVMFGDNSATSFTVNSATRITAVAPGGSGTVDVTVTTPSGTSAEVVADQYTYTLFRPTVTSVSPDSGPRTGGTTVIITGTNFASVTAVKIGTKNATSYVVESTTRITAVVPSRSPATVHVTVTNSAGTSTTGNPDRYTYTTQY